MSKQVALIVIFFVVLISLAVNHSFSTSTGVDPASHTSLSSIVRDDIYLVKNNKLTIGNTCLDYKGLDNNTLLIDLYLLDLDREQSFSQRISRKQMKHGIRLGDYRYRVLSAKDRYVKLKVISVSTTP